MAVTTYTGNRRHALRLASAIALAFSVVSVASAETLVMPNRQGRIAVPVVVWGITTQANGTPFTLNFGDGNTTNGNVVDRSYIAVAHTYAIANTYTATLTVGAESKSVQIEIFDPATISAFDNRALGINMAIEDGLRYLWFSQLNRTNFDTTNVTNWGGQYPRSFAALATLAFENHGYLLPNNNTTPTGLYPKYLVQRSLNYVADQLSQVNLTDQSITTGGNPCVGSGAGPDPDGAGPALCVGLQQAFEDPGYGTAVAALPLAASNALSRTFAAGLGSQNGNFVAGKSYGEVLQRAMNAIAWGQNDQVGCSGRGGWIYQFSNNTCQQSDGSTIGWDILALLDAGSAGTVIPGFVKTEFVNFALPAGLNNDGTFDYRADQNPASDNNVNIAKAGIALQGQFYKGSALGNAQVQTSLTYISNNWNIAPFVQSFYCGSNSGPTNGTENKGCAYGMFNIFKALKLYAVKTLPGVNRPAGPGPIPANDWHADYEDYLVNSIQSAGTESGGFWNHPQMNFSCCTSGNGHAPLLTAMAELILAPTALIPPDPGLFSTVGLSPASAVNPPGTSHTVTATVLSSAKTPIAGVTVDFEVISGQNIGKTSTGSTNANGQVSFTYTDTGIGPFPQTDTIQAFVGNLGSNVVSKTWANAVTKCDADGDKDIDSNDLLIIRMANGQVATGPNDPRDANGDKKINVADTRYCQLRCTRPGCATEVQAAALKQ
jgi:hypothetical protein